MSEATKLRIEDRTFPNGESYKTLYVGATRIGSYDCGDTGFTPFGC